jgi:hypothetical protein
MAHHGGQWFAWRDMNDRRFLHSFQGFQKIAHRRRVVAEQADFERLVR